MKFTRQDTLEYSHYTYLRAVDRPHMGEHEGLPEPEAPSHERIFRVDEELLHVQRSSVWPRLVGKGGEHDPIIIKSNV